MHNFLEEYTERNLMVRLQKCAREQKPGYTNFLKEVQTEIYKLIKLVRQKQNPTFKHH